jgi:hypothetical protein
MASLPLNERQRHTICQHWGRRTQCRNYRDPYATGEGGCVASHERIEHRLEASNCPPLRIDNQMDIEAERLGAGHDLRNLSRAVQAKFVELACQEPK